VNSESETMEKRRKIKRKINYPNEANAMKSRSAAFGACLIGQRNTSRTSDKDTTIFHTGPRNGSNVMQIRQSAKG